MSHSQHLNSAGEQLPSVSRVPGIFKKDLTGFQNWICKSLHEPAERCCVKAADQYMEEAASLGNDIHELREAFLKGDAFSEGVPEYQAKVFDPIAAFYKSAGYKPLFIEEAMTGKTLGGTIDGAGTFSVPFWNEQRKTFWAKGTPDNVRPTTESVWVEDLKIKSKLDITHPLQLYGYRLLLQEVHGVEANWGLIIRREKKLDKTPEIQLRAYYLPAYKKFWEASVLMWHFLND